MAKPRKSEFLMVRVRAEELLTWQRAAKREGLTLSEWVRRALNQLCDSPQTQKNTEAAA